MEIFARDNHAHCFPVSIKCVGIRNGRVVLLKNKRDEWELPGGKLDLGETPQSCLAREIFEELGVSITVDRILDTWLYHITEGIDVFIVTYGCLLNTNDHLAISHEHKDVGLFEIREIGALNMPTQYKVSINTWAQLLEGRRATPGSGSNTLTQ